MNILTGKSAYVPERQTGDMLRARRPSMTDENPAAQDKQVNTMTQTPLSRARSTRVTDIKGE
jgi:hypothetical protein